MKKNISNQGENVFVSENLAQTSKSESSVKDRQKTQALLANDSVASVTGSDGGFVPKKKFTQSNKAMLITHAINNIASVFVSTFLVSYIYKISSNYILNIGLFYLMTYLAMCVIYYIASLIVDRTNRAIVYKVALLIRGAFMLCVVLVGENLAQYVVLAGLLHGFSEGCYWSSYNVMKNELVSSRLMKNYSTIQLVDEKVINVIVPIILGKLIDANSFKLTAIIVLAVVLVQIVVSFFIKSKRPENSSFNMKEFFSDMKNLGENNQPFKMIFIGSIFYGIITIIAPLNTVLIMLSFDSNFSLGILTSIFSIFSMVLLVVLNVVLKKKKQTIFCIIASVLCPIGAILVSVFTNPVVVAIYNLIYTVLAVVHSYVFDVYRNLLLKKFGLYHDIAEFQCCIETLLAFARIFVFVCMVIAGVIGAGFGVSGMIVATKVLLSVMMLSVTALNITLIILEKKLIKLEII